MKEPLRIVLLLDDPDQPEDWCVRLVERLVGDHRLTLVAILPGRSNGPPVRAHPVIRAWVALEQWTMARPSPADRAAYRAVLLAMAPRAGVSDSLASMSADVILDLSSGAAENIDPALARHGIWFAYVPDGMANLSLIAAGAPTSRIALFRRAEGSAHPVAIDRAELNTKFIAARNALFMREKLVTLILRALRRTWLNGAPDTDGAILPELRSGPTIGNLARYLEGLSLHLGRRVSDHIAGRFGRRPGMFFLKSANAGWRDFEPENAAQHLSDGNSYYADPFLWERDGLTHCFFEEYDYRSRQGHISVGQFIDGQLRSIKTALKTDYHLSFPYLFEHEGMLFMLPETHQQRRIEVWKCERFPDRWALHATALDGELASDSTLNVIDGEWWLFSNISNDPFRDMNTELHLFRVDGPDLKVIEPHAANPVVMDTTRARNAGRILNVEGKKIRPAQENSHGAYGYALKLMEIQRLSLEDYAEAEVRAILPATQDDIVGCHHFDTRGGLVVMDACMRTGGRA